MYPYKRAINICKSNLQTYSHIIILYTGNRYDAIVYPSKPWMCPHCFGVADLVSPRIHKSLRPRRFCYSFRITKSAFLTVSFITDYREPYLNQDIQKKHFSSPASSSYFSTSCIDVDAGTEVKVCLHFIYLSQQHKENGLRCSTMAAIMFHLGSYDSVRKFHESKFM
jgi:hypothetical protein